MYVYIYIYIEREREREGERDWEFFTERACALSSRAPTCGSPDSCGSLLMVLSLVVLLLLLLLLLVLLSLLLLSLSLVGGFRRSPPGLDFGSLVSSLIHCSRCRLQSVASCRLRCRMVSFHNFKSQNFKLSVSNPKNKYVAWARLR